MALCSLILGVAYPVWAGPFDVETKLTAADAAPVDFFGFSVGISDGTAIVGAWPDDDAGSASGSAYLFDVATGRQLAKLTATGAAAGDQFGYSVAISGGTAIVGAIRKDDAGDASGAAYLFDVATGRQLAKLTAADAAAGDQFGVSVAISGKVAIVGAWHNDHAGDDSGAAYLFDVTTGRQLFKLTATDAAAIDQFGVSVGISGGTAIVGANRDNSADLLAGSAYLFDVTTGRQLYKLVASDGQAGQEFGTSVAISGDTAVVGAVLGHVGIDRPGVAYLFNATTGDQIAKLTASDASPNDQFGISVDVGEGTAIVGAFDNDDAGEISGSAYLFDATTGRQLSKLTASDAAEGHRFGFSVGIDGGTIIIGAHRTDEAGTDSGSIYLFNSGAR